MTESKKGSQLQAFEHFDIARKAMHSNMLSRFLTLAATSPFDL